MTGSWQVNLASLRMECWRISVGLKLEYLAGKPACVSSGVGFMIEKRVCADKLYRQWVIRFYKWHFSEKTDCGIR